MKKYSIYIGIDTGVNTGIAIWQRRPQQAFLIVESTTIHRAMKEVESWHRKHPGELFVRVEDPRQRKWFGKMDRQQAKYGAAVREGVGSVKRDASIWECFLKDLDIPHEMVAPKNNKTKMTATEFMRLTGWPMDTNEHGRDSAMLVFGY